ncbi:hypothetical protein FF011L_42540 [Roseimaritima multifibrata]|uniref:Uncharacterized protein n=1 Tax=Roseimaritima multifibrata TaxID=1930274 RepID=A0A517MKQ0_9BACT|nr:hypothetical protein FF011L_42540 [Roseimaritima multifibrata]
MESMPDLPLKGSRVFAAPAPLFQISSNHILGMWKQGKRAFVRDLVCLNRCDLQLLSSNGGS